MLDGEQFDIVIPQRKVNKALIGIIARDESVDEFTAGEILKKRNIDAMNEKYRKRLRNILHAQIMREIVNWREYFNKSDKIKTG